MQGIDLVEEVIAIALQEFQLHSIHDPRIALSFSQHNKNQWGFRLNYGQWLILGCEFEGDALVGLQLVQAHDKGSTDGNEMFSKQPADADVGLAFIDVGKYLKNQPLFEKQYQRGVRSAHQLFGNWTATPYKNSHQKMLAADVVGLRYRWIVFMEELGSKLLEFRNRQGELINLLGKAGVEEGLTDRDASGNSIPLSEIDPFTALAALNKYGDEKRSKMLVRFGRLIGVAAPEFVDVHGMPTSNALGFWYMPFKPKRSTDHVPRVWDFFEKVLSRTVADHDLESMIALPHIEPASLTQAMFWIRPTWYLPLDVKTSGALARYLPSLPLPSAENFPVGYLSLLKSVEDSRDYSPWTFAAWSDLGHQIETEGKLQELVASLVVDSTILPSIISQEPTMPTHALNTVLYGPPGTGKTFATRERALRIINGTVPSDAQEQQKLYLELIDKGRIRFVTFHQSYSYEDFVEGIRPTVSDSGALSYDVKAGVLRQIATSAMDVWELHTSGNVVQMHTHSDPQDAPDAYVLIIDEINRGNISSILGEAITLLEDDKRRGKPNELLVDLPYSKERFCLPPNLYVIGTMNTADRSIALVDLALRRRFVFEELMPDIGLLSDNIDGINVAELLRVINDRLEILLDRNHTVGHAYFMGCTSASDVSTVLVSKVIPLLQEYFYDDLERVGHVLNDNRHPQQPIIIKENLSEQLLFGEDLDGVQDRARYRMPTGLSVEQIKGIYS